ncbi:hypothetical protein VRK_27790 [Vibrio sp. MEBiC08052]|nr:hypothetical protein VRK_27790 [Vibrio sp. MEBiC08052]
MVVGLGKHIPVFPVCTGMNRVGFGFWYRIKGVPRMHGDEPVGA